MSNKLKITFLSDSPNGWMAQHTQQLISNLRKEHSVRLIHNEKDIKKGDILFILSFYKLVPENTLRKNAHNIVIHASNLPSGKGWSPSTWQILEGKNKIPLTLFEAIKEVDAGQIYFQDSIELEGTELIDEWQDKMGKKISEMVLKFIKFYPHINGKKQEGKESFYPKRTPEDSKLDINKTIQEQFNLLRVVDNEKYPAFFIYKGKRYVLKIYKPNT